MSILRLALTAVLLALAGTAAAQAGDGREFSDPDFELTLTVPPGMAEVPHDAAAAAFGLEPDAHNLPRSEAPQNRASHKFIWHDTTGRERSARLIIEDLPPPFGAPDQVVLFAEQSFGLTIEGDPTPLKRGEGFMTGLRLEGTRQRRDTIVRGMLAYFPIPPERYVLVYFEALDVDWDLVSGDFVEALRSVRFPVPEPKPGAKPGGAQAGGGGPGAGGPEVVESWESLEVAGSLVLALVLLMGLFVGGRSTATA